MAGELVIVALMSLFSVERPRRLQFGLQLTMSLVFKHIHIHGKSTCLIIKVKVALNDLKLVDLLNYRGLPN